MTLVLVRHGETAANSAGTLSGWTNEPLSEAGRIQARALGEHLSGKRFDRVISSDLPRAVETAQLAGFEAVADRRWREIDFGRLEGQRFEHLDDQLQASLYDFDQFVAPEGESTHELVERLRSAMADMGAGRHLVFTHGGPIRALLRVSQGDRRVAPGTTVEVTLGPSFPTAPTLGS